MSTKINSPILLRLARELSHVAPQRLEGPVVPSAASTGIMGVTHPTLAQDGRMDPGLRSRLEDSLYWSPWRADLGTCAKPVVAATNDIPFTLVHPRSTRALDSVRFFAVVNYCNLYQTFSDRAIGRSLHVLSRIGRLRRNQRTGSHR